MNVSVIATVTTESNVASTSHQEGDEASNGCGSSVQSFKGTAVAVQIQILLMVRYLLPLRCTFLLCLQHLTQLNLLDQKIFLIFFNLNCPYKLLS